MTAATDDLETTRLRYSLKLRSEQSQRALFLVAINITAILFLLWDTPRRAGLVAWVTLLGLTTCFMYVLAKRLWRVVESAPRNELLRYQNWKNWMIVANTCAAGSGVWWLHGSSVENMYIATLYQCCYSMAGSVNASTHLKSFIVGLFINIGSAVVYWTVQGKNGIGITVPLASLMFLLITGARFNTASFIESLRIRQQNKELLDSRVRYLAAANHDLRQPLQALSLYINVIAEQLGQGVIAQTVRKAKETCRTLEDLFGNLLELSHYDTGRVVAHAVPLELSSIVRQLDNEFDVRTRAKGLEWSVSCPDSAWVQSDPVLLSRLLPNLLDNALRYTEVGSVSLCVERTNNRFEIVVRDSGRGIEAKDQETIFHDFTQLDNPSNKIERGMGLGLAIVRRIDDMLGLRLTLSSAPNKGTEFRLWLPILSHQDQRVPEIDRIMPQPQGQLDLVIWAIEDDENIRDALALQMTQWGCEIRFAKTQQDIERLRELTAQWPDLFFLDDTIDNKEVGVELAKWLISQLPSVPILVMTATENEERFAAFSELGLPLLRKPISEEKLFQILRTAQSQKNHRR